MAIEEMYRFDSDLHVLNSVFPIQHSLLWRRPLITFLIAILYFVRVRKISWR